MARILSGGRGEAGVAQGGMYGEGVMCMAKGRMPGEGGVHGKGGHAWWGACVAGGHVWWGVCMAEECVAGGMIAEEMATEAGGTHPTGMHSCLENCCQTLHANESHGTRGPSLAPPVNTHLTCLKLKLPQNADERNSELLSARMNKKHNIQFIP